MVKIKAFFIEISTGDCVLFFIVGIPEPYSRRSFSVWNVLSCVQIFVPLCCVSRIINLKNEKAKNNLPRPEICPFLFAF
jgi:hypothetical protein